jgi:GH15 family glucan-1,4-alpha-glucosidase
MTAEVTSSAVSKSGGPKPKEARRALRIEDYALVGDCETAALVGKNGSIDWMCWPRFDSPACFAALVGSDQNGYWEIAPAVEVQRITQQYRPDSLILETQFETAQGVAKVIDFMPLRGDNSHLIRIVSGVSGQVPMAMKIAFRFDYGKSVPWVTRLKDGSLRAIAGPNMVVLRTGVPVHGENMHTVAEFTAAPGHDVAFDLAYGPSHLAVPRGIDAHKALEQTESYWKKWMGQCSYHGEWATAVQRSLITLKALTYWPTGGIVAAATTSLPERIGGARNWDYRFCWIRDATLMLNVLMEGGYYQEAGEWKDWLLRAVAGSADQMQIMYGIGGERELSELELKWLSGYEHSSPVRVGNAASEQLQLDVYGELASALHRSREGKLPKNEPAIDLEWKILEHLEQIWRQPDEGIWEVRGGRKHFTHSKVMAWVAFDCAIKSCEQFQLKGPLDRWKEVREEIHRDVCQHGFDAELNSFVQSYGSKNLDAALLMIPKSGFLPPEDPRVVGTVAAIERELTRDGFVLRYKTEETEDGLPPGEGVFLPCSFWLADVYARMGRVDEARALFERLMRLSNHVGLLSEEYDPVEKRLVGNFPQVFSHLALCNTAFNLQNAETKANG